MKNTKKGYTLSEILVTLGIISVIAGITIPAIVNNTHAKAFEATADRTAVLLEESMTEIIHRAQSEDEENGFADTLSAIQVKDVIGGANTNYITSGTVLFDSLGSLLDVEAIPNADKTSYISGAKNANGTAVSWNSNKVYKLKKQNSFVIFQPIQAATGATNLYDSVLTDIYVDANGNKTPNRMYDETTYPKGDIFKYRLINNGHIVRVR